MDLITRSDDERLNQPEDGADRGRFRESPRASLNERDVLKVNVDTLVGSCENLMQQHSAALSRAEAAEKDLADARGKLCRAKEVIEIVAHLGVRFCEGGHGPDCDCVGKRAVAVINESSPCSHAHTLCRIKGEFNKDYGTIMHPDVINGIVLSNIANALFSSSPCAHAEEAKRLREAVEAITHSCRIDKDGICRVHSSLMEPLIDDLRNARKATI